MRSAIFSSTIARSAGEVLPQAGAALCAASSAKLMSASLPRATWQNTSPVTGVMLSKYSPSTGATQSPPM